MPKFRTRERIRTSFEHYIEFKVSELKLKNKNSTMPYVWQSIFEDLEKHRITHIPHLGSPKSLEKLRSGFKRGQIKSYTKTVKELHLFIECQARENPRFASRLESIKLPYTKSEMATLGNITDWRLVHLSLTKNNLESKFVSVTHLSIEAVPALKNNVDDDDYYFFKFTQKKVTEDGIFKSYGIIIKDYGQLMFIGQTNYEQENDITDEGTQFLMFRNKAYKDNQLSGLLMGALNNSPDNHEGCVTQVSLIPDSEVTDRDTGIFPYDETNKEHQILTNNINNSWGILMPPDL